MKRNVIIVILTILSLYAMAEDNRYQLVILAKDGSKVTYNLRLRPKITFSESDLVVTVNKVPTVYPLSQTARFFYEIAPEIMGDVDDDGVVDIADAVLVINHFVGKPVTTFNEKTADVDVDGVIDLADAVLIINYYVGRIDSLAPLMDFEGVEPQ